MFLFGIGISLHSGYAQELGELDAEIIASYPAQSTVPVIQFVRPDTEKALSKLGKFFYGGVLTADMATVNTGRYLYFSDGFSELWYYPMSGAFDWRRMDSPVKIEFDIDEDNLSVLEQAALSTLEAIRGDSGHLLEQLVYVGESKVLAYTGTLESNGADAESFVRRIDIRFRQNVAGIPVFHGSWAVVSFCGDMEICRVKVLLREIQDVTETEILSVEAVTALVRERGSEFDEPFVYGGVDNTRQPIVGYSVHSENYRQAGAGPILALPICRSDIRNGDSQCDIQSVIVAPLVDNAEEIERSERAVVIHNESPEQLLVIERPLECDLGTGGKECAP